MDLRAIRADLSSIAQSCGFQPWDYSPEDPGQTLPCVVVGSTKGIKRMNRLVCQITLGIDFYVNLADTLDATTRLDTVLSTGADGSLLDAMDEAANTNWRSLRFESAGPYEQVEMPGGQLTLHTQVIVELTA